MIDEIQPRRHPVEKPKLPYLKRARMPVRSTLYGLTPYQMKQAIKREQKELIKQLVKTGL
jgi:hypothetical protein